VLVIGSVNTDLVCRVESLPRAGETVRGSSFASYPGGKGANQAVAAARAAARVTFVGAVGDDAFGVARRADLAADGIDVTRLVNVADQPTGTAVIVVEASGDNQIVVVMGANAAITADQAHAAVSDVAHDVLSLTLEIPLEAVREALRNKASGARAVLNAAPFDERVRGVLPFGEGLIANQIAAAELVGDRLATDGVGAARALLELGPAAAVVTLGAAGAVLATEHGVTRLKPPKVSAVDATGAGDAFCGAFAAWLAHGQPLAACAQAGVAAGALAVTRHGAQPALPRRTELLATLDAVDVS
jgi:ribokinase